MGFLQNLTGWHAVIILAIVLLIFGAAKLPALARSVGQSMKILKTEMHDPTITTSHPAHDAAPAAPTVNTAPTMNAPTATKTPTSTTTAGPS